ncbi:MAG: hypothetical protein A4E40_00201 [Methanoregulaceae archaeon PtaU1.Bin059]|nr:MAG: hypothetical protein A4E39_01525 [Methanoregulaceae archaeon PtaB.Bin152]OPY43179.1 MAG: hypothetical protein A4E40_00201 [Methanoregulaceae archaeon PtaU1.Bin059]
MNCAVLWGVSDTTPRIRCELPRWGTPAEGRRRNKHAEKTPIQFLPKKQRRDKNKCQGIGLCDFVDSIHLERGISAREALRNLQFPGLLFSREWEKLLSFMYFLLFREIEPITCDYSGICDSGGVYSFRTCVSLKNHTLRQEKWVRKGNRQTRNLLTKAAALVNAQSTALHQ